MSTYSTKAIILKKTQLRDSDLIFTLLLEDGSLDTAVARGILKPRAKMGGTLSVFAVVDVLLAHGKNMDTICEAASGKARIDGGTELARTAALSCVCELLCRLALPGQEQPRLFDMGIASLTAIASAPEDRITFVTAAALMKITSLLGYRPRLAHCVICDGPVTVGSQGTQPFSWGDGGVLCDDCASSLPSASEEDAALIRWLDLLISTTFDGLSRIEVDSGQVGYEALRFIERWLAEHVDVRLKSLTFLFANC